MVQILEPWPLHKHVVPGAQGDEEGLREAQEHQGDTLEAEDKVAGH